MRQITYYKFDELSPEAQEKAIESYRKDDLNYDWWDGVYEMVERAANLIGIELDQKSVSTRHDPVIYFSGFYHQGSGSCFSGSYSYAKSSVKSIKTEFPEDKTLHSIAEQLQKIQALNFYKLEATIKGCERYYSVDVEVYHADDQYRDIGVNETYISEALKDFNHWIYSSLQNEYEYLTSDEQVKESILANEVEFTEDGDLV